MNERETESSPPRAGTVALVGRPNAGKSTLVNQMVGEHVSIVTHKPQTTRHRVTGIVNDPRGQVVLVDTPGLHRRRDHALNRHLNRVAAETLPGVDLVVVLVDAANPTDEDRMALAAADQSGQPYLLVFNKIDKVKHRAELLPLARAWTAAVKPEAVLYISALRDDGVEGLLDAILARLPEQPPLYPPELFTREPMRFLAAELVREQLLENLHQEIPYGTTVVVESFEEDDGRLAIAARILVAEKRHKGIVIGKGGQTLKRIGSRARQAMQTLFDQPVRLDLNVAVMEGWMDREALFDRLGYGR
ncbi:GTPase Era [Wenzhouxiangella sp. XN79A]|uniref:GTPase Era n=1 Tax=Wenzhouxiangella sp. XN79A TaxID=2724193 RepID=UPI00144A63D7|nr:GTPase Era [Wenzhouxiangella sp. XN79A]NKI34406.1 GTPase Era [Wenzhouxiangella sp. XN79A]